MTRQTNEIDNDINRLPHRMNLTGAWPMYWQYTAIAIPQKPRTDSFHFMKRKAYHLYHFIYAASIYYQRGRQRGAH